MDASDLTQAIDAIAEGRDRAGRTVATLAFRAAGDSRCGSRPQRRNRPVLRCDCRRVPGRRPTFSRFVREARTPARPRSRQGGCVQLGASGTILNLKEGYPHYSDRPAIPISAYGSGTRRRTCVPGGTTQPRRIVRGLADHHLATRHDSGRKGVGLEPANGPGPRRRPGRGRGWDGRSGTFESSIHPSPRPTQPVVTRASPPKVLIGLDAIPEGVRGPHSDHGRA